ncbi:MAG: ATP-binding protein [Candidatus Pseudobacter hemicellulosilyticus]|uniref:histidine kinase n=1 Tax=Candidatus Pseudobacter hemicellulosilyticus TaxID=3121375 RepID=A0AAJ6BGA1_9BACT|nr:MAG: ATP-binding protein [Pseudobacter sp.]
MRTEEIVKVTLQNEMDLILAHRRSMRLAELVGCSLAAQTTFATAVSEVSRMAIEKGKDNYLVLCISQSQKDKHLIARIIHEEGARKHEGLAFAQRLVDKVHVSTSGAKTQVELFFLMPGSEKQDATRIDEWRQTLRNEPAVSPYEEIKRKNDQLQSLANKLRDSETQYKTLTNSLPIIIFSADPAGNLIYANDWLQKFTGQSIAQLNKSWEQVIHSDDLPCFLALLKQPEPTSSGPQRVQCRLKNKYAEDYLWHMASVSPLTNEAGTLTQWIGFIVDINAQKLVEQTLQDNEELMQIQARLKENEAKLEGNINELNRSNQDLQQFAYVASHDLQEPVRKISIYSDYFLTKYHHLFDSKGTEYLRGMRSATQRMRNLIHDLLSYSQIDRNRIQFKQTDLNQVIQDVREDLELLIREKEATIRSTPLPQIMADFGMMRQLFANIIVNSLKYSSEDRKPIIEISHQQTEGFLEIAVKDNGIGFEEKYLPKMFKLFQRLHSEEKYKGTGLGLAICGKIVALHNGQLSATSKLTEGATFTIKLPYQHNQ